MLSMIPARELVVVLALFGVVAAVFASAGIFLLHMLYPRSAGKARLLSRKALWARRICFALAGVGMLCIGYSFLEPYWLSVTHVRLPCAHVPKGAGPVRIAQISDLHCEGRVRLERHLPEAIAAEKPDIIVFTGDALNSPDGLPVFRECMTRLAKIAPTYAVYGNWDENWWANMDLYGGTGVTLLGIKSVPLTVRGVDLQLAGPEVWNTWHIEHMVSKMPPDAVKVVLYHLPGGILPAARQKADLVLAGHTHGGQVALPFYGALITLSEMGKRFEAGLYRVDQTWLYVNRGIGLEGGRAPRIRFWARPEVTIIDLVPADER